MRKINYIIIHCSATPENRPFSCADLEAAHLSRGFLGIGYHYYIRRDGTVYNTRSLARPGAHAIGYNANSIGICYEGGLSAIDGKPADTRTPEQRRSLCLLVHQLCRIYPDSCVCGHRDLSPDLNNNGIIEPEEWIKACPCFDVSTDL